MSHRTGGRGGGHGWPSVFCFDTSVHHHSLEPSFQTCWGNIFRAVYLWGGGLGALVRSSPSNDRHILSGATVAIEWIPKTAA